MSMQPFNTRFKSKISTSQFKIIFFHEHKRLPPQFHPLQHQPPHPLNWLSQPPPLLGP